MGSDEIAIQLRQAEYLVHTMREVYSEKTAQRLRDERWLRKCGREGWAVFSKDQGLRDPRTNEHRALVKAKVKAFVLPSAGMKEMEQIARYVDNKYRIAMRCKKDGPFICTVEKKAVPFDLHPPTGSAGFSST